MNRADTNKINAHYSTGNLCEAIRDGFAALGKSTADITIDDLAAVDELHIGGRAATEALLIQLGLNKQDRVLDVGCGIGGTSRFIANTYCSFVNGIDLTVEFVETGTELCRWVGLDHLVELQCGNALETGLNSNNFDAACMLHVGMNIPDKTGLFAEISRVLRPGGRLAVYDVMQTKNEAIEFPVPWSTVAETSAVEPLEVYIAAIEAAGFEVISTADKRETAIAYIEMIKQKAAAADGPSPIGLHLVMGSEGPVKFANMIASVIAGRISPIEIIARKL